MKKFSAFLFCITICLESCTTLRKTPEKNFQLPASIDSLFSGCQQGEGSLQIKIHTTAKNIGPLDADWNATTRGWKLDFLTPLATSAALLKYEAAPEKIEIFGRNYFTGNSNSDVEVRDEFLYLNGYFSGLKAHEIPCFLNHKLPRNWTQHLNHHQIHHVDGQIVDQLDAVERERNISMLITRDTSEKLKSICSTIHWSAWLGFVRRDLKICSEFSQKNQGILSVSDRFTLIWTTIDDAA